jgi:hypothetical protein
MTRFKDLSGQYTNVWTMMLVLDGPPTTALSLHLTYLYTYLYSLILSVMYKPGL